ncbi:sensor histidine kinase [Donghicola eburneus]|uniref:histidine kinase n=1 Tax=Donghicola eburneus TaxID=393278 RepID=A0A1M4MXZ4_9RHOB|nr:HAMP domain-containing sensor histidine kinase [Donghicola eburneus]SCM66595.1 putative sensor histidine kinase [Donghicola eburneus]
MIILCRLVFVISGCVLGIFGYLHSAHSQHQISRITQASAQIAALDKLGSSLHNELLTAVLEPDILTAKAALARFERDAIHSLGILDRLTVEELAMISESERAGEESELDRPRKLRDTVVKTVAATQRVVNIRQSSDIMPDATSALAQLEVERAAITNLVNEILEDEREEMTTALGNLGKEQRTFDIRAGALLLISISSGLLSLLFGFVHQRSRDAVLAQGLGEMAIEKPVPQELSADRLDAALQVVASKIKREVSARVYIERELEQRTAALQLSASKLKQVDETRRRFLADLGHSLKTPLAIARGSVEAIAADERRQATALSSIDKVTQRVSDLMQLAQSDDGRLIQMQNVLEVAELLDNRIAELRVLPAGECITFTTDEDGPYEIEGDREALVRMFDAIIENGLQFATPAEPLCVDVFAGPINVTIAITDHGPGVAEGDAVFDRGASFFQGGSGIGLSMAEQIAKDHGGRVILTQTGSGARFEVTLPLRQLA